MKIQEKCSKADAHITQADKDIFKSGVRIISRKTLKNFFKKTQSGACVYRSILPEVFCKKDFLKMFLKFKTQHR